MITIIRYCLVLFVTTVSVQTFGHTLFLRAEAPQTDRAQRNVALINGTFFATESPVVMRRLGASRTVRPSGALHDYPLDAWQMSNGKSSTVMTLGSEGTYVLGVGTQPAKIRMDAEDFETYLTAEGLQHISNERRAAGESQVGAAERYAKFAKTIFQNGGGLTDSYATPLGHPIEFVPLSHPAKLKVGDTLALRLLFNEKPLSSAVVYASHEGLTDKNEKGFYKEALRALSDNTGVVTLPLEHPGHWYVRVIHIRRTGDSEYWYSNLLTWLGVDERYVPYESYWATLTFEVLE